MHNSNSIKQVEALGFPRVKVDIEGITGKKHVFLYDVSVEFVKDHYPSIENKQAYDAIVLYINSNRSLFDFLNHNGTECIIKIYLWGREDKLMIIQKQHVSLNHCREDNRFPLLNAGFRVVLDYPQIINTSNEVYVEPI